MASLACFCIRFRISSTPLSTRLVSLQTRKRCPSQIINATDATIKIKCSITHPPVQVGQSPKPWRSARKAHRLGATLATCRSRPSIVGTISRHVENFVLCSAHCRVDELAGEVHAAPRASASEKMGTGMLPSPPKIVLDATEDYFAEQDTLQQWLEDCTEDGGQYAFTRTAELFASWKAWCEAHNIKPSSEQALSVALVEKGFTKSRNSSGQRGFRNLSVKG
jgi:hypothetical protein